MVLVKTGNVTIQYLERRFDAFKKISAGSGFLADDPTTEGIFIWKIVSTHIEQGNNTTDFILGNLNVLVGDIDNDIIRPMPGFLAYRGLTPIMNIVNAISSFPTFPWDAVIKRNAQINSEFMILRQILEFCAKYPLLGYKASAAGRQG